MSQNQTDKSDNIKIEQSPQLRNTNRVLRILGIFSLLTSLLTLFVGIQNNFWPLLLISASFAVSFIFCIFSTGQIWPAPISVKLLITAVFLNLSFIFVGAVFSSTYGLPAGIIAFSLALLLASNNPTGWLNEWFIGVGLGGILASTLLGILAPFPQINSLGISIILVILAIVTLIFPIQQFRKGGITTSLRIKLILASLFLSIIPLIILAFINISSFTNTITQQTNDTLSTATKLAVSQMDQFITSNLTTLENEASLPAFTAYLQLGSLSRPNSDEEAELAATLSSLKTKEVLYSPSYGILNTIGTDIYDTDESRIGVSESDSDYFHKVSTSQTSYASTVEFNQTTRESVLNFITPIFSDKKTVLGFLRMSYDARILQDELEKSTGLAGVRSYPILIDENGLRLADTSNPSLIYHTIESLTDKQYSTLVNSDRLPSYLTKTDISSPINQVYDQVFIKQVFPYTFFDVTTKVSSADVQNTATFGKLTTQSWYIVYLQENTSLLQAQQKVQRTAETVSVIIALIVALLITILSTFLTRPIRDLTQNAQLMSEGYLDAHVDVTSTDEIGQLGKAFNLMTQQMRSSFAEMDKRVRERTLELNKQNETLRYRSRQLQTVTDVARIIVSKNDMESLLTLITELISDRFNYYHAGIFLIDDAGEYAVLRAANSTGGKRMLNRQHKLRVGQVGIVGYVTGTGNPRIATDVGKDAVFFNNPDLPNTKSEMALPLKIEDKVIGALDIQSTESNAFTEEDIALFTTLSDQISVAISNNRLLADTQKALEEAQNLHRQYLNQEWTRRSSEMGSTSYKFSAQGLSSFDEELPEVKMVYESGRPVTRSYTEENQGKSKYSTLAVPILLRGEVIGVIHLSEAANTGQSFTESDLVTIQTLSDQLAQTLEGARLFEQTIRRADRERRVLEITSKIRSTNDPQRMLEITLEELKQHLGASQAQIVLNLSGQGLSPDQPGNIDIKGRKGVQE